MADYLKLAYAKPVLDLVITQNRTLFADKGRAELAMAAEANRALHVPFHGHENVFLR
jgi:hypothetical protein